MGGNASRPSESRQKNNFMTYGLAKKLKDAGFPQEPIIKTIETLPCGELVCPQHHMRVHKRERLLTCFDLPDGTAPLIRVPTLSELIEACGDEFLNLSMTDFGWIAHCVSPDFLWGRGFETPEEAVANLWLAINEKKI